VDVEQDAFGNLLLSCGRGAGATAPPIVLAAHMDHPAFVVAAVQSATSVDAEFRGGVGEKYFVGTAVRLHSNSGAAIEGVVESFAQNPDRESWGANDGAKYVRIRLENGVNGAVMPGVGDVVTWALPPAAIDAETGLMRAPACDDLAGVAAAVGAFDLYLLAREVARAKPQAAHGAWGASDLRLLFTRAEEIGFVGAIAAASARSIPVNARIVAIENSKSFPESPIGAGPIVRVGDFTSTFDPDLTYRVGKIAQAIGAADNTFKYQRKLMPGGTCEASAYQAYGYTATCVCLPLGNYHNMDEQTVRIASEVIDVEDFHGLVTLLAKIPVMLDDPEKSPMLRTRLDALFASRKVVLERKLV
jgi:putative aminopeptidase FrvX